jgi:thiosulfate/3-mercaptopyruvate sulfurtransferase
MNHLRLTISFALAAPMLFAQGPAPLLVDAEWLSAHLHDPGLVIIHTGPEPDYKTQHIPGARRIATQDIVRPMKHTDDNEIMIELPEAGVLRSSLESFGISDDSRIVVYFANDQSLTSATRLLFTLDYMGLGDHCSLLNGGLPAWVSAGKPVTAEAPSITPGHLTARPTRNLVADADFVKSRGPKYKLIDARAPVYYSGTEATYKKNGHIPGAVNIPFSQILDDKLIVNKDHVAELFHNAGVKPGDTVVAYCHIGLQATMVIYGARLLGNPVMLYDGSFEDWAKNNRGPVEK